MSEYRLRVGNVVLGLDFENDRESRSAARYFNRESSKDEADVRLSIRFRNEAGIRTEVPTSLFLTKKGDGNGFSLAHGLIEGRFSLASGEGELAVQRLITRGGYKRIYEQVFYQAYVSAARKKGAESFLLHSSGVIRKEKGYAFSGKSGSGKSTVTRLSSAWTILNDEITIIDLSPPDPVLRDTPFNGFFQKKEEGSAGLAGVFLLEQAPRHLITRTTDLDYVKTLSRELIPPIGLETPFSPAVYMDMFDGARKICARAPLYRMEFKPDRGFWDRIDEMEGA